MPYRENSRLTQVSTINFCFKVVKYFFYFFSKSNMILNGLFPQKFGIFVIFNFFQRIFSFLILHLTTLVAYPLEISRILLITLFFLHRNILLVIMRYHLRVKIWKIRVGIYFPEDLLQKICEIFPKEFTANKFWFFVKQEGT